MRSATRLLANAAKQAQPAGAGSYLTPLAPTGLTGVLTHPNPRPHLIFLYNATLEKLKTLPDTSAYRASVEALTKHRLNIVEKTIPQGYEEWKVRVAKQIEQNPQVFGTAGRAYERIIGGERWVIESAEAQPKEERDTEWDDDLGEERNEGPGSLADKEGQQAELGDGYGPEDFAKRAADIEAEPGLTRDQVSDIENQVGAGLIEEIVSVAQKELDLVDTMKDNAVWEELVERPVEGQWSYFQRDAGTGQPKSGSTQTPP